MPKLMGWVHGGGCCLRSQVRPWCCLCLESMVRACFNSTFLQFLGRSGIVVGLGAAHRSCGIEEKHARSWLSSGCDLEAVLN